MLTEVPRSKQRKRKEKKQKKTDKKQQESKFLRFQLLSISGATMCGRRKRESENTGRNKQTEKKQSSFSSVVASCKKQRHDEDDDQITLWQDRNAYPPQTDTILPIHVSSEIDGSTSHDTYPNLFAIVTYQVIFS
jgi:hypothetical protein